MAYTFTERQGRTPHLEFAVGMGLMNENPYGPLSNRGFLQLQRLGLPVLDYR